MRAAQIFEPATPIKIREPRNLHLGRVLAVALLAVVGFGAYRLVSTHDTPARRDPERSRLRPVGDGDREAARHRHARRPRSTDGAEAVIRLTATPDCWVGLNSPTGQYALPGHRPGRVDHDLEREEPGVAGDRQPAGHHADRERQAQQLNTVQVVTLSINPASKTPVTVG